MKHSYKLVLLAILCLGLVNCATWNKKKCQTTNWDTQGYSDGSQGRPNSGGVYADKCQKRGINVNTALYNKGYQRGLGVYCSYNSGFNSAMSAEPQSPVCSAIPKYQDGYAAGRKKFCSYDNGYKRGLEGLDEGSMCSGRSLEKYMSGYEKGRHKFAVQEIENLQIDIKKANEDLDDVRDKIADKQYQLSRMPRYSREESVIRLREETEYDIDGLMRTRDDIRNQIESMESQLSELEREVSY